MPRGPCGQEGRHGHWTETKEDGRSFEQARADYDKPTGETQVFRVVRATVAGGRASGVVKRVAMSGAHTFRHLDAVIARLPEPGEATAVELPPGTEPGFLHAMTSLMREQAEAVTGAESPRAAAQRSYVFANKLYTVGVRSSRRLPRTTIRGRAFENVIDSEFEARLATKGKGDRFRALYGTEGELRGVPLRIVYRPNWWFEAEVVLADGTR